MRKPLFCFALLALSLFFTLAVQAQTKGTLSGTITDPAGAVVPGAAVEIKNNANGISRTATTADNGVFQFTELEPGTYTVSVQASGFKRSVASEVVVNVGVPATFLKTAHSTRRQVAKASKAPLAARTPKNPCHHDESTDSKPMMTVTKVISIPIPAQNPFGRAHILSGSGTSASKGTFRSKREPSVAEPTIAR